MLGWPKEPRLENVSIHHNVVHRTNYDSNKGGGVHFGAWNNPSDIKDTNDPNHDVIGTYKVFNNVFVNLSSGVSLEMSRDGKDVSAWMDHVEIKNNIFLSTGYPIKVDDPLRRLRDVRVENNLYYDFNTQYWYQADNQTQIIEVGALLQDPLIDTTGEPSPSFTAQNEYSPVLDAGVVVGLDYLGSAPDIGAFESVVN